MQMEYRRIADLEVSVLCLGAWMFGGHTPREVAHRIVGTAREAGVNFIDTADVYADGESERIVGTAIAADRERWTVATKVGAASGGPGGLARRSIMRAIDGSRLRLGLDCVDIYYLHVPDPATAIEETLETLGELIAQGKARHFGVSNYAGWEMADMVHRCRRLGVPQPIVCQPYYNILNRVAEVEILPAARHFGIGVAVYSPLAGGMPDRQVPRRGGNRRARAERGHPIFQRGVSRRHHRCGAAHRGARRRTRHDAGPLRDPLDHRPRGRDERDRGAAHRTPVGGLSESGRAASRRGGRGLRLVGGRPRAALDTRIHGTLGRDSATRTAPQRRIGALDSVRRGGHRRRTLRTRKALARPMASTAVAMPRLAAGNRQRVDGAAGRLRAEAACSRSCRPAKAQANHQRSRNL